MFGNVSIFLEFWLHFVAAVPSKEAIRWPEKPATLFPTEGEREKASRPGTTVVQIEAKIEPGLAAPSAHL